MIRPAQLKVLERARVAKALDPAAFAELVRRCGGADRVEELTAIGYQRLLDRFTVMGFPAHYVMDRDGKVYQTLPDGAKGAHMLPASRFPNAKDGSLSNNNTMGMEVIAKDDRDVTPAQVEAAKRFSAQLQQKHPGIKFYGHGEENPGHKQLTEGKTITDAVRNMSEAERQQALRSGTPRPAPSADRTDRLLGALKGRPDAPALRSRADRFDGGDPSERRSPRFSDPARMKPRQPGAGDLAGGGAGGRQRLAGGPSVIQHFHGGFDEQATARRAMLEQNREIRRAQAGALHDIGRIA